MSHLYTHWYLLTRPRSSLVFLVSGYRTVAGDQNGTSAKGTMGRRYPFFSPFQEKCAVRLPQEQNFWILTDFLDRDCRLHCGTMEEQYELPFCSSVKSCIGKSHMLFVGFCHTCRTTVCWDSEILYHGNVTLFKGKRDDQRYEPVCTWLNFGHAP